MNYASSSTNPTLHRCIISVCDACGDFIEYWGFKSIHGRIWAYLAISTKPLSQRELADALEMSKGSISVAVNELIEYGLVRLSSAHRHAPCEAVMDVWPVIVGVLRTREWILLESARVALEGALFELQRHAHISTPDAQLRPHAQDAESRSVEGDLTGGIHEAQSHPHESFSEERVRLLLQMTEWAQSVLKLIMSARIPRSQERWGAWMGRAVKLGQSLRGLLGGSDD